MNTIQIAKILNNIADILELQAVPWKPQAYRQAAQHLETFEGDLDQLAREKKLSSIPGVGEHIAQKIEELVLTGKLAYYEKLKKSTGIDIEALKRIPSLGPKRIKQLHDALGVKNISDLEKAISHHKIRELAGFGDQTEKNILQGIKLLQQRPQRFSYKEVVPIAKQIKQILQVLPSVQRVDIAGSFRRKSETVGDLDILVMSARPLEVMKTFTSLPKIVRILAHGQTKSSILLTNGLQVDLRVVKEEEYGAALLYFTGSKEHNIALRQAALRKGYTLNEYALTSLKTKRKVAGRTEKEIYLALGFKFISPEKRIGKGELVRFKGN